MSRGRTILRACLIAAAPATLACAIGAALAVAGLVAMGQAALLGGAIALPLAIAGAIIITTMARADLPIALMAALAAFILRVVGVGIALALIPRLDHAGITAAVLVGSVVAALAIEMYGLARSTLQGPARA